MNDIEQLIENNKQWSLRIGQMEPGYFEKLSRQQAPRFLWIGCSDSRVPANEIIGLPPGALFVHRNIANIVYAADLNCLAVLEYAIHSLKVSHIIVCGHYGCGGVQAAMQHTSHGFIDNWLNNIREVYSQHREDIKTLPTKEQRFDRLCELNVMRQVRSISHTTFAQEAWVRGQALSIHGWIYGLNDGLVKDLGVCVNSLDQVATAFHHIDLRV